MAGIVLTIEVDDKGTVKVKQFSDETKKAFDEMKKGPEQARAPMAAIQESWVGLTAKVTLATGVIYGVTRALGSFVNEAAEAEQIENRLRFALETTGYTWQYAKSAVDQFANSIQESTRFSDEQARQALTDMMIYTNDFAKAQMGAKLAMDMSIRTGQDLGSTSRLIGMAMSGNVEMLGRYIPELRNLDERLGSNATMADKAAYAMKILQEKFGGTAQADMNTYSGTVARFKNAWSDLKETIGMGLLPVLKETFEWLTKIIKSFQGFSAESASQKMLDATIEKFRGQIEELKGIASQPGLVAFQKEMIASQITALEEEIKKLESISQKRQEAAGKLAAERKPDVFLTGIKTKEEDPLSAYNAIIQKANEWGEVVVARAELAESGWIKEKDIVEQVRDEIVRLERETNEWGEITVGRQELVEAGWAKAAKEIEEQTKRTDEIIQSFGSTLSSAWSTNLTNMIKGTENFGDAVKNIFTSIGDAFINTVTKMITNWLIFGSLTGEKNKTTGNWGGIVGTVVGLFSAQEGGIFTKPTPILIGDAGDEAAIPLKNGKVPVEGGGEGILVQNFIQVTDPSTFTKIYGPIVKKLSEQSVAEAKRFNRR